MSSFTKKPALKFLENGKTAELLESFEYHVGSEDSTEIIEVSKGFVTDGASIPRFLWSIIGHPWGRYAYGAILHDWLYHTHIYTRKRSDQIFLEAMGVLGVPKWKRNTMYSFVRAFSWLFWNKQKPFIFKKMFIILFVFLLASCSSLTIIRNPDGTVKQVKARGLQETSVKPDGTVDHKMKVDWLPKDVLTIYKD